MTAYIVLYEHYLRDHKVEVKGVFLDESKAINCRDEQRQTMGFRDECWIVEKMVTE